MRAPASARPSGPALRPRCPRAALAGRLASRLGRHNVLDIEESRTSRRPGPGFCQATLMARAIRHWNGVRRLHGARTAFNGACAALLRRPGLHMQTRARAHSHTHTARPSQHPRCSPAGLAEARGARCASRGFWRLAAKALVAEILPSRGNFTQCWLLDTIPTSKLVTRVHFWKSFDQFHCILVFILMCKFANIFVHSVVHVILHIITIQFNIGF